MSFTKIFLLAAFITFSAAVGRAQSACALTVDKAPTLRGVRLGMSLGEVKSLIPDLRIYDQGFGESSTGINFSSSNERGRSEGVRQISLRFIDERLTSFSVDYDGSVVWQSTSQFVAKVSEALKLPAAWDGGSDPDTMICNGFKIIAGPNSIGMAVINAEDIVRRRKAEEAERKRQSFTP